MDSTSQYKLSLVDLPPDIVRIIIPMAEAIFPIKLISPMWNHLVLEFLNSKGKRAYPIEDVTLEMNCNGKLEIEVLISECHWGHFGINSWTTNYVHTPPWNKGVWHVSPPQNISQDGVRERLKTLFDSCSSIGSVAIKNADRHQFEAICDYLGSIPIRNMSIVGNDEVEKVDIVKMGLMLSCKHLLVNGRFIVNMTKWKRVHQTCQMGSLLVFNVIIPFFVLLCLSEIMAAPSDHTKILMAAQTNRSPATALNSANDQLPFFAKRHTPNCFPDGQPQCVTTVFYYFECCADDCCMRLQPVTFVVFVSIIVLILTCIVIGFVRKCRASPRHKYHYAVKN